MALLMKNVWCGVPLHHPSTTAAGKFYDAIVVEIEAPDQFGNLEVHYFAVFNYGAGRASRFGTGAFDLGIRRANIGQAIQDAETKLRTKVHDGYAEDHTSPQAVLGAVPTKVRAKLDGVVAGSAAFNPPPTQAEPEEAEGGGKPPRTATPRRKKGELVRNSAEIERAAATILTVSNAEVALAELGKLRAKVDSMRADMADADSALEMATMYVHSKLQ